MKSVATSLKVAFFLIQKQIKMINWFIVKVKYTKQLENGSFKRVTEPYLLPANSFTDAEARIYEELGNVIRGEFMVVAINRFDVHDIFGYEDADTWYKAKVVFESVDADSEKSKKITQTFLTTANSAKQAYERIKESLSTMMADFEIPSVSASPIVEVFTYNQNN